MNEMNQLFRYEKQFKEILETCEEDELLVKCQILCWLQQFEFMQADDRVKTEAGPLYRFKVSAILCTFLVATRANKGLWED